MSKSIPGALAAICAVLLAVTTAQAANVFVVADITVSETWTTDNTYILTRPIYVTSGATLTIEPGVIVRGEPASGVGTNDPGTLIIARGSKIQALGSPGAPIVFTDLFDDNVGLSPGTPPYDNALNALSLTGQWGGVVLLGRGYVANNALNGPDATREVQIEGLTAAGGLGLYGNGGNDDDDSGAMSYVSIRYGGFNLSANNEINGLTLGAVGRQTDLDHIEVFQNKDDMVEFFGGAANLKYLAAANGGDDSLDYDEGWRGKVQFLFAMQGTPGGDKSDKGAEQDGGNGPDGSQPYAIPAIYNATLVGLGQKAYTDKARNTALHFRDNAGGRWYNSAFLDFGGSALLVEGDPASALSSGARAVTPMSGGECSGVGTPVFCNVHGDCPGGETCLPWFSQLGSSFQLELQDNAFWCIGAGSAIPTDAATGQAAGGDNADHYDPGLFTNAALDNGLLACASPLPIRTLTRIDSGVATAPDPILGIDPRPVPGGALATSNRNAPLDGFFERAAYKGAFPPGNNWAAGWTNLDRLGYFPTCAGGATVPPNEVDDLGFRSISKALLSWSAVTDATTYDAIRVRGFTSDAAATFAGATCVAIDATDTQASDQDLPAAQEAFYYLIRANNACAEGEIGVDADGDSRVGATCP